MVGSKVILICPSEPISAGNLQGWNSIIDGNSIEYENVSGTALSPGQFGTFTLVSSSSPVEMTTSPAGESVAYVNGNGPSTFAQNSPGVASPIFSVPLAATPEPSSTGLFILGGCGLALIGWKKLRPQTAQVVTIKK